jgi:group I intron endonuclease
MDDWNTGVYGLYNKRNGKVYVGSASRSLAGRIRSHLVALRTGVHHNRHLQRAWIKYGSKAFVFKILERCAPSECIVREQYWIDQLDSASSSRGYNLSPTAGSVRGIRWSVESRASMPAAAKRGAANPGTKEKQQASQRARFADESEREKIRLALTGRKHSEEFCCRASEILRNRSDATRQKLREAALRQWADPETRNRMTASNGRRGRI